MNNLKLECLKLAVEYWKGHNVTIDHMKDTADSIYDYCKDEPDIDMKEFERKCSGEWSIPVTREQYLKGKDLTAMDIVWERNKETKDK